MTWREYQLGELIRVKHGYAFKSEFFASKGAQIVLTPGNFYEEGGFKLRGDKDRYYTGRYPSEYLLKKGDIIVAMTEQGVGLLGSSALIPEDNKYLHNQRLGLIELKDDTKIDKFFLYKIFNTEDIRQQISSSASGIKVKHTSPERIYKCKVTIPPLPIQQKIARILASYDDLIENNLKRIKLLEEMAQITYEEWFVRLRFPGHESTPINSDTGLPEGWELLPFEDLIDFKEGPGLRNWQYRDEGIPFLNIRVIKDGDVDLQKVQYLDPDEVQAKYQHFLLQENDHVISTSGTLGRLTTIRECHLPLCLNTSLIRMRMKNKRYGTWLIKHMLSSSFFQNKLETYANGAAQANFGPMHLKQIKLITPSLDISKKYETMAAPIEELIKHLRDQNQRLREARDILLPRLMTGKIDVESYNPADLLKEVA